MNKEEKAAYMKKYREEHLEEIKANRRYWYRQNKERVKQYNKTYYETHGATCQAKWLEKNRDKWNAYMREYRKRKKLERSAG